MKNRNKSNIRLGFMGPKFLKVALSIIAIGMVCGVLNATVLKKGEEAAIEQVAQSTQNGAQQAQEPQQLQQAQEPQHREFKFESTEHPEDAAIKAQRIKDSTELALAKRKEMFSKILDERQLSFNFGSIARGILGVLVIILIAWLCSTDRKRVNWRTVGMALLLQFIIAFSVLMFPAVQKFFELFGKCFVAVLGWTKAGADFLFGPLMDTTGIGYIFVFQILPTIVFFSALTSLLFYLGILQKIVWVMGWVMAKLIVSLLRRQCFSWADRGPLNGKGVHPQDEPQ